MKLGDTVGIQIKRGGAMSLKSECGQYVLGERLEKNTLYFRLYRADGSYCSATSYWSNLMTTNRIRFEVGNPALGFKAIFSYPRYPRWFCRRWTSCFDIDIRELAKIVEKCGGKVLVGYKPNMNCWNHIGFRGTSDCVRAVDAALAKRKIKFSTRRKPGMFDIECPDKMRWEATP